MPAATDTTQSAAQDTAGEKPLEAQSAGTVPASFDTWITGQPEEVRALVEDHTAGLRSALTSERGQRKDLERQLKDLSKRFEKGSEERTAVEKMQADLSAAQRQADFYAEAHKRGVANLKLAWMAAKSEFGGEEEIDWDKLKQEHPQLFAATRPAPAGNAGNGTTQSPKPLDMNAMIRRAAGIK